MATLGRTKAHHHHPISPSARTVPVDRAVLEALVLQDTRVRVAALSDVDLAELVERLPALLAPPHPSC